MFRKNLQFVILSALLLTIIYALILSPSNAQSQKFVSVSCGQMHTLCLDECGNVWMWGRLCEHYDDWNLVDQLTPVKVPIDDVIAISAGVTHSAALKNDGTVWTWGYNGYGQLGDGTNISKSEPVQVQNLNNVISISAGALHSLALKNDGTVWAWGCNNAGQLGDGTVDNKLSPVQITSLNDTTKIYGGSFAVKSDGTVWTWGKTILDVDNTGHAYEDDYDTRKINTKLMPYQLHDIKDVISIATDGVNKHTVFIKNDGTVWAWGYNSYGILGDGSYFENNIPYVQYPVQVKNLEDIKDVSASIDSSMALKNDGTVWVWGSYIGDLKGVGTNGGAQPIPVKIPGIYNVSSISLSTHAAFLTEDGSVWMVGRNQAGQIGDGTTEDRLVPVHILRPDNDGTLDSDSSGTGINDPVKNSPDTGTTNTTTPASTPGFDLTTILIVIGVISIISRHKI